MPRATSSLSSTRSTCMPITSIFNLTSLSGKDEGRINDLPQGYFALNQWLIPCFQAGAQCKAWEGCHGVCRVDTQVGGWKQVAGTGVAGTVGRTAAGERLSAAGAGFPSADTAAGCGSWRTAA